MLRRIFAGLSILIIGAVLLGAWIWRPIGATHPFLASADLPKIIPLRAFYANQDAKWAHSLSRDGAYMAWLEVEWFKTVIKVKNLKTQKIHTLSRPEGARSWRYYWAPSSNAIFLSIDDSGWENYHLAIDFLDDDYKGWKPITFGEDVKTFVVNIPKSSDDEIIIAHNKLNRANFDMYRLNLRTGETTPIGIEADRSVSYRFDSDGKIIGRTVNPETRNSEWSFETRNQSGNWREIARGNYDDFLSLFGTVTDQNTIYGLSNRGRNVTALVEFNLDTAQEQVLHIDQRVDLASAYFNPQSKKLLMATKYPGRQERVYFSKTFEEEIKRINSPEDADILIRSNVQDFSKSIVFVHEDDRGGRTVLIDRENDDIETIQSAPIAGYRNRLSKVEPVFIKARDGLDIPAFVSRPKGVTGPAPMVIYVHGGPVSRSWWGYTEFRALMNNRGYAVLDVNYRGSWGYGRKFAEAAKGEIAGKMSSDIIDARNWAVEQGIADPEAVGIFGISWGGFEVMTALTQNSDLFAAGININGVADMSTMLQEVPDYWRGWVEWLKDYGADPVTEDGASYLEERSPLYHVEHMQTPLLVVQAANDVRVVQSQSDRLIEALQEHDAPVEYKLVQGVGHSPYQWLWQKRYLLMRDVERFYAKHLGGRAGGHDYAILGAHILPE